MNDEFTSGKAFYNVHFPSSVSWALVYAVAMAELYKTREIIIKVTTEKNANKNYAILLCELSTYCNFCTVCLFAVVLCFATDAFFLLSVHSFARCSICMEDGVC